jgi:hypothetical protein
MDSGVAKRVVTDFDGSVALAVGSGSVDFFPGSGGSVGVAGDELTNSGDSAALSPNGENAAWADSSRPGIVDYTTTVQDSLPSSAWLSDAKVVSLPDASDVPLAEQVADNGELTVVVRKTDGSTVQLEAQSPTNVTSTPQDDAANTSVEKIDGESWTAQAVSIPVGAATSRVSETALPDQLQSSSSDLDGNATRTDMTDAPVVLTANNATNTISGTGITDLAVSGNGLKYFDVTDAGAVGGGYAARFLDIEGDNDPVTPAPPATKPATPQTPPSTKPLTSQAPEVLPPAAPKPHAPAQKPQVQAPAPQPKLPVVSG